MLESITPLILTYNEAPNIARTLAQLAWAREIVVLDSFSTDGTVELVAAQSNARLVQRPFDDHARQWDFGLRECGISSEWVLALDADYVLTDDLLREIRSLQSPSDISGYRASFIYCIEGHPLHATLYTPVTVLYRREGARYLQDGHTQRVSVDGKIERLSGKILHDDRKSLSRWIASQDRYMRLEADKVRKTAWSELSWSGRIRKLRVVAPFAMLLHCLLGKGLIFAGRAGVFYTFQRVFAEVLLSLYLLRPETIAD